MIISPDRILSFDQGSPEWHAARCGRVTASRIDDLLARLKNGGEAASRRDYRAEIVAETLTQTPAEGPFVSREMMWGTTQEPYARAAYEVFANCLVDQVGMVLHPTINRAGASPDGIVGSDGLLEIKCPKTATHVATCLSGEIPAAYLGQMFWQMACTGALWVDFVSFDPRLPRHLQLFVRRLLRDDARIAEIEAEVSRFLAEVDAVIADLNLRMAA